FFFTIYTASGMTAGAKLFSSSFDLTYTQGLWIGAIVIIAYTFLGGFIAVSWTDFIQGILMLLALIILPVVAISEIGGWQETLNIVGQASEGHLQMVAGVSAMVIISNLAWGLGYFGQPHIIVRFMGIRSHKEVPKARFIGMTWMILGLYGAIFVGFIGFALAQTGALTLGDGEEVFILMSQVL